MKRFIFDLILFIGVFIFPWWIIFSLSFALIFYFDSYLEGVIIAFIIDVLFRPNVTEIWFGMYILTIISLLFFVFAPSLKKRLRLMEK